MVSRVIPVEAFDLVIFGGTGDLARRKIFPGLYRRFQSGQMPPEARIVGAARSEMTDDAFRTMIGEAIAEFVGEAHRDAASVAEFLLRLGYVAIDARGTGGWQALKDRMRAGVVQAFYFSVAPALFGDLAERVHARIHAPQYLGIGVNDRYQQQAFNDVAVGIVQCEGTVAFCGLKFVDDCSVG